MCTELPNIWKIAAVPLTVLEIKRSRGTRPTDHCTPKLQIYPRTGRHALRQGWHRTCQFFCSPPSDYQHHLQLVCGWRLGQLAPFQAQILDSGLLELSKTGESFFFFSPLPWKFSPRSHSLPNLCFKNVSWEIFWHLSGSLAPWHSRSVSH